MSEFMTAAYQDKFMQANCILYHFMQEWGGAFKVGEEDTYPNEAKT